MINKTLLRARLMLGLVLGLMAAGCTDFAPKDGGDLLALGDSVLAWNGTSDQAIPDVIGRTLNRNMVNRAVPGAQFDNGSALFSAVGFNIQQQYPGGTWNWIIVNGGANDLGFDDCNCGDCTGAVNSLIGADAMSGAIPSFLTRLR